MFDICALSLPRRLSRLLKELLASPPSLVQALGGTMSLLRRVPISLSPAHPTWSCPFPPSPCASLPEQSRPSACVRPQSLLLLHLVRLQQQGQALSSHRQPRMSSWPKCYCLPSLGCLLQACQPWMTLTLPQPRASLRSRPAARLCLQQVLLAFHTLRQLLLRAQRKQLLPQQQQWPHRP